MIKKVISFFRFRLFSFIFIGIIVIIMLIALLKFFYKPQNVNVKLTTTPIRYTIEIQRRDPDFIHNVKIGADVEVQKSELVIGKIVNVKSEPYLEDTPDYDNKIIRRVPVDGFETIYIEIEAQAQIKSYTTLVGTYEVLIGKAIPIITKDFAANGYVVGIDKL